MSTISIQRRPSAASEEPGVEISNVTKQFSDVTAVDNASLTLKAKSFVSIVGPSGCGKSTLMRMVAGLIKPTSGEITVRSKPVRGPLREVGMVFQAPVLMPWRRTLDNILFVAEMGGLRRSDWIDRANELIDHAGLGGFANSYPHELSGGMQQRVAICRAMLLRPSLILMDEPFGALDVMTRERMGFALQDLWSESKSTVLFVTHSITEAVLLSDTVVVMSPRPGRIRDVVDVDLPRPRTTQTLRDPLFIELSERVREGIESRWID